MPSVGYFQRRCGCPARQDIGDEVGDVHRLQWILGGMHVRSSLRMVEHSSFDVMRFAMMAIRSL